MKLKKERTLFILATTWPTKGLPPKIKQIVGVWTNISMWHYSSFIKKNRNDLLILDHLILDKTLMILKIFLWQLEMLRPNLNSYPEQSNRNIAFLHRKVYLNYPPTFSLYTCFRSSVKYVLHSSLNTYILLLSHLFYSFFIVHTSNSSLKRTLYITHLSFADLLLKCLVFIFLPCGKHSKNLT